jgi:branched-chain amino acid transport system ATP-binding protein
VTGAAAPLLSVAGVRLAFGGLVALNNIRFEVYPRELFAIIGPNGAGKTTMLNCLAGLHRPGAGTMLLDGIDLGALRPAQIAARGVARTFQNVGLFGNLSVLANIMLGRHCRTRTGFVTNALRLPAARSEEIAQRKVAEHLIGMLGLGPYRDRPVGTLPYGIRKLVELARALAMEPKLLLLDEPAAGMNLAETEHLAEYIQAIRREVDVAIILIEHDMQLVMDLADRILVIDFGVPIATGTPEEIQNDPNVIKAYLGEGLGELMADVV